MSETLFFMLTLLTALGSGLMAGVFFIFSNTVMRSLGELRPPAGVAAMQAINRIILNPLFFLAFLGTGVLSLVLAISQFWRWQGLEDLFLLAGSLAYLLGSMLVTIFFNVPMNDALQAVEPESDEAGRLWARYLRNWTAWNHVRTVACLLAAVLLMLALT